MWELEKIGAEMGELWSTSGLDRRHMSQPKTEHSGWSQAFRSVSCKMGKGVVIALLGPRGTGKTQLAAEAIRYTIEQRGGGAKCIYRTAYQLFLDVKETFQPKGPSQSSLLTESFISPRLLVIDEIHARNETPWEDGLLTHIIDARYRKATKDTILISNLEAEAFKDNVGPSIADRITENGGYVIMDWESFRGRK